MLERTIYTHCCSIYRFNDKRQTPFTASNPQMTRTIKSSQFDENLRKVRHFIKKRNLTN
uniref:Uncharacterized protein n=1 Tax=Rhizophora mucronata TaxID=61149 RepID=A0A2P2P8H4_RHIMU